MMKKAIMRTISMLCIFTMITSATVFARNTFQYTVGQDYSEDFESKTPAVSTTADDGTGIMKENDNTFMYIQQRAESYFRNFYMNAESDPITDTDKDDASPEIFVSADIMIPSLVDGAANSLSEAQVMMTRRDTNGLNNRASVWYVNDGTAGKFVAGHKATSSDSDNVVIYNNVQMDKWYNIFIAIDWNKGHSIENEDGDGYDGRPIYYIYMDDRQVKTGPMGNSSGNKNFLYRIFQSVANAAATNSTTDPMYYLDNIKIINTNDTNYAADLAYFQAHSLAVNAIAGYGNGQVPQSMIDRLKAANIRNSTEINNEIALFKGAVIDETNGNDTVAAFVRINNMPTQTAVVPGGFGLILEANAYTQKNTPTADSIVWTVTKSDGTAIDGTNVAFDDATDTLTIAYGFQGELKITATTTRSDGVVLSDTHRLDVVPARVISLSNLVSENNEIRLEGSFSDAITQPVNITVTGDDGDAGTTDISATGTISVNPDNTFSWSTALVGNEVPQKLTISISGVEIADLTIDGYYYGTNWETVVLNSIKSATTAADMEDILELHSGKLYVDKSLLSTETAYSNRILNNKSSYLILDDVVKAIRDTEFVINFANISRDEIIDFINNNSVLLGNNGFDINDLTANGITDSERAAFYVSACDLIIDKETKSVSDICSDLNGILEPYKGVPVTGPTISPGYSGGYSGGSSGGNKITLVAGTTNESTQETNSENTATNKTEFSDVSETDWFYDAVTYVNEAKIMVGDGKNMRPNDFVTRGELVKIIVEALDLSGASMGMFSDGTDKWWGEYAEIAAAHGIVNGLGDGIFGGDAVINREMLAVMIDRAITAKGLNLYDQNNGVEFADGEFISDYAKDAIARLARKGIVSGIRSDMYAPSLSVTRAEAAQIIYNILKQL